MLPALLLSVCTAACLPAHTFINKRGLDIRFQPKLLSLFPNHVWTLVSYVSSIVRYQRAYFQAKLTRSPLKGRLRSKYLHSREKYKWRERSRSRDLLLYSPLSHNMHSHIVVMTHFIIHHNSYMHLWYQMYTCKAEAVNKRSDSTTQSCYLSSD